MSFELPAMTPPDSTPYLGSGLSITQLVYALKRKLNSSVDCSIQPNCNLQQLFELEASMLCSLSKIKGMQNAYSPINRLPCEMICEILALLPHQNLFNSAKAYGWIMILHVCRYWRYTALSFPSMWWTIDSRVPDMAQKCIQLSGSGPLRVILNDACLEELLQNVAKNLFRVHELILNNRQQIAFPMPPLLRDTPAPTLHTLRIIRRGLPTQSFPLQLFQDNMPCLAFLKLCRVALTQPIPHITNLVTLHLENDEESCCTSMSQLLDVFRSNPNLCSIRIVDAGPRTDNELPGKIVRLENAESVVLSGCLTRAILKHLSFPPMTKLAIAEIAQNNSTKFLKKILPPTLDRLENFDHTEMLGYWNDFHNYSYCTISGLGAKSRSGLQSSFEIEGRLGTDRRFPTYMFQALLQAPWSLDHVHTLWLNRLTFRLENDFPDALGAIIASMPNLKAFVLLDSHSKSVFKALMPKEGDQSCPCPKLTSLTIYQSSFSEMAVDLLQLATERKKRGTPLDRVWIGRYPYYNRFTEVETEKLLLLKEVVRRVEQKVEEPKWPFESELRKLAFQGYGS